jgi:propanol-preferring alcohol dehydrogenase
MKAMVLRSPALIERRPLHSEEVNDPKPQPGQIRVRVAVCGVCHTDLHTVEGELALPRMPLVPGHQIVGVVDQVGEGVSRHRTGDRVGIGWLHATCGRCDYCLSGVENLCPNARFTGLHADGGYAQYAIAHESYAFPLPAHLTPVAAAPLLCGGIIGYRALRLSGLRPGGRLGLFGFGGSAHLAIQVARHWGCEVYVFTRGEEHRRHATELGAVWTGEAADSPPLPLDSAITFAPAGWIVPLALGHLRPGGALAINAIHMTPIPEMPYSLIYGERVLRSVTNYTRKDAVEFLELAGAIPFRTDTQTFALEEANEALALLKAGKIRGTAVLALDP